MSSTSSDVLAESAPAAPTPPRALPNGLAPFLVFLSSGAVLVLETVSLRLVGPYVGVTLQVTSSVIGMALGAIAYGAWMGGWLADRRDPRTLLAPALVLAGIATAVTLPVVRYAGEALRGGAAGAVLLLTALAVLLPAALLAGVTPLVVKLQLADLRRTGQVVGRLSGIGTLGGITATLVTGFVLVAALPSTAIVLGLAAVLGVTGLVLGAYLRRRARAGLPGRGRTRAALAVLGLAGAGLSAVAPNPCDVETAYHCARVEVDEQWTQGRYLYLNSAQHSYVDLADPTHLKYAYTQWIGLVADLAAPAGRPLDALHLGGGGFTIPRYVAATRPGSDNLVFEIDGGLVDLDRRELGVRTGPRLRARVGDARILLGAEPTDSRDLIVGDAFGHLVVPWHLATREMAAEVRRVLRPGGIYVQNVIDLPPDRFIRAELATVAAEFRHVALIAPPGAIAGQHGANFLIVAADTPLPLARIQAQLPLLPEPAMLLHGDELAGFVGDTLVLTDDYAPVDQLLATA
ncbi:MULTISPECIES: fused MFS/spermidine synthase [Micromonospora]|uniref:fused MFS/spermidine synthase n=1 Tax=Micromonospora TaxID=1873 RepID=UPI0013B9EE3F|nr:MULTISPECIES: fused MFS/spermidine synthase [Micromonospora]NES12520.1 spermidine synthase [Micromonospora sp. PPF5-17B]NES36035.1 spermidine synthase [Micromonospora solifontis]NES54595.1 spermidine synthase [Micromonospora sp. PPF5-6]